MLLESIGKTKTQKKKPTKIMMKLSTVNVDTKN